MTPYYEDDSTTIWHGDCFEVMAALPAGCAELVAADPPYFRVVDAEWDRQDWAGPAEFLEWIGAAVVLMDRALHERGTLAVFCHPDMASGVEMEVRKVANYLNHIVWRKPELGRLGMAEKESLRRFFPTSERIILAEKGRNPDGDLFRFRDHVNHSVARDVYADIRATLVAARDSAGMSNRDVDELLGNNMSGHYFCGSQWSLPTADAWEQIAGEIRRRGGTAPEWGALRREFDSRRQEFDSRRREFDSDSRRREFELLSDVWTFAPPPLALRRGHPTQKPEALMEHIIATLSRHGDTVLDPFAGTGTTLRVAKNLGRRSIGIEKDERWCEVAATRLAQEALPLYDPTP